MNGEIEIGAPTALDCTAPTATVGNTEPFTSEDPNSFIKPRKLGFISGPTARYRVQTGEREKEEKETREEEEVAAAAIVANCFWNLAEMGGLKKRQLYSDVDVMKEDDMGGENIDEVSESESDDELMLSEPSKDAVYNREGILDKLGDISWPENLDWMHKLSIDYNQEQDVDVNDDLTRELAFYTQALEGTRQAFEKLQSMGLPFLRPPDYYAEMVKTDAHMEKLRSRLLVEKKRIEEAEERRKAREAKKIAKEVQAQKLKERAQQKKQEIESVQKWRKQRQQSGFADGGKGFDEMGIDFEDGKTFQRSKKRPGVAPGDRSGGRARQGGGGKGKKGMEGKKGMDKKRKGKEFKDSKFGFGGRKGLKKQNTADTVDDFRGFNKGDFAGKKQRRG